MRQTSIDAYNAIKREGLLSRVRWAVYDFLYKKGPLTGAQIHAALSKGKSDSGGTYTSRLSELRKINVVYEVRKTTCPLTGRRAILWDVTDRMPIKFSKPIREKCKSCNGKGYVESAQGRLF